MVVTTGVATAASLAVTMEEPLDGVLAAAAVAEAKGYQAVWRPEGRGHDAMAVCSVWADRTNRIGIGTGVVSAFSRSALALAQGSATLDALSKGRFRLGLGAGDPPDRRRTDVVREVGRVLQAVRSYQEAAPDTFGDNLDARSPAPIYLAALGPRMVGLGATVADGILLNWAPAAFVQSVRRRVDETSLRAGRDAVHVDISVYLRVAVGSHREVKRELNEQLANFARNPWYARHFARLRVDPLAPTNDDLFRLCAWGTGIEISEKVESLQEAGADEVVIRPIGSGKRWWQAVETAAPAR